MKKVKPGSVDTLESIMKRKRLADPYLKKCAKAVTQTTAIVVTERPVKNTQNERQKLRARITVASEGKRLSISFAPAQDILPDIKKGQVVAVLTIGKPRKIYP
jgi:precorrin-2 methylase